MFLVTTAISGLMAGVIQTAPAPQAQPQTPPAARSMAPTEDDSTPLPTAREPDAADATDLGTVVVTGVRPRGGVDSDIPADVILTAEDIQAYGASSIEELLTYLEPLTRSSRGRADAQPVTLVNGRRTTGFREIAGIPPEAIDRIDILPEEVALRYGYKADQRVVNFVLKSSFRSLSGQVTAGTPTEGGRTTFQTGGNALNIAGASRYSLDLDYRRSTPLFETERDIVRTPGATPFDLIGNITGLPCDRAVEPGCVAEIDPGFSTLVGETAVVAPVSRSGRSLPDFAAAYGPARTGDLTAYRTLLSASEQSTVRGTVKRDLNSTTQATINANLTDQTSESFSGLPGLTLALPAASPFSPFSDDILVHRYLDAPAALSRQTDTLTGNLGVVLDGFLGEDWRWTLTGAYDRIETDTSTGRGYGVQPFQTRLAAGDPAVDPFGALSLSDFTTLPFDTAQSVSESLSAELNLTGDLFELPAGDLRSTFTFGADTRSLDSSSTRYSTLTGTSVLTDREQSRDRLNGQASFDLPLFTRPEDGPNRFGDLDLNLNLGYEDISDFGGLKTLGAGLNWDPIQPLSFLISYTNEEGAPSISQLNDPIISTPAVPVFDFLNNETVLVTRIDGGNPDLASDNRQVWKAGVTFRPLKDGDLTLSSTWTRSVTDDPINVFPAVTPDLEAALPERFVRGPDNELLSFDARALNFDRAERQDIRTGFNFSKAFGTPTPPRPGAPGQPGAAGAMGGRPMIMMQGGPPPGGGGGRQGGGDGQFRMNAGGGGRGGPRGGGMQPGQGRFNLSIYHTYRIQDEFVIRDGLPTLDLLDGAATSSRGGSPRNEIQLQAGVFKDGFGSFLNANWREATRIDGGAGPDLRFSGQTTVNLNVFMDLNQRTSWVERFPVLKGSRINLGVQNLFDSEVEVTSTAGDVPLNYQPDFLDPAGRTVSLTFRKILF